MKMKEWRERYGTGKRKDDFVRDLALAVPIIKMQIHNLIKASKEAQTGTFTPDDVQRFSLDVAGCLVSAYVRLGGDSSIHEIYGAAYTQYRNARNSDE